MPRKRSAASAGLPPHVYTQGDSGNLFRTPIPLGNGKQKWVGGFTSPTACAKYYDLAAAELKAGRPLPPKSIVERPTSGGHTLCSYIEEVWWPRYERQGIPGTRGPRSGGRPRAHTLQGRRSVIDRWIRPAPFIDWPMSAINHGEVQKYLDHVTEHGRSSKTGKRLEDSTLLNVRSTLYSIYDQAINIERIVDHNPAKYVALDLSREEDEEHPHENEVPKRPLTWEEVGAVCVRMLAVDRFPFWAISGLGMRIGEAFGVQIADFLDASKEEGHGHGYLWCGHRMQINEVDPKTGKKVNQVNRGKNRQSYRRLTLGPTTTTFIREYVQRFHGFDPFDVPRNDPRLRVPIAVTSKRKTPKDQGTAFRKRLEKIFTELVLDETTVGKKPHPHLLRKTVSSLLHDDRRVREVVPEAARSAYLGHGLDGIVDTSGVLGSRMTARVYTLATQSGLAAIAGFIEEVVQKAFCGDLWALPGGVSDLIDTREAAQLLGLKMERVRELIKAGSLERQVHPWDPRRHYVRTGDCLALREKYGPGKLLTRGATAARIGVSKGTVGTLIRLGKLVEVTAPFTTTTGGWPHRVTVVSIEAYERTFAADVAATEWVTVEEAANQIGIEVKALRARASRMAASSGLRVRRANVHPSSRITHVATDDLATWRRRIGIPDGYVGYRAALSLGGGIAIHTLRNWRLQGRVRAWTNDTKTGNYPRYWFCAEDLRRIAAETASPGPAYVRLPEAALEVGSRKAVTRLLKLGFVDHVTRLHGGRNLVWVHREQLLAALDREGVPSGYVSVRRAAIEHGVHVATLTVWAREGRIASTKVRGQWYVHGKSMLIRQRMLAGRGPESAETVD